MRPNRLLVVAALFLAACNSYHLKYKADPQPSGANLFADFVTLQDSIAVEVDTDSLRLEDIYIKKSDGTMVHPLNISYPTFGKAASLGTGVGIGTGNVGLGTGLSMPVGPERARGLTSATFSTAAIGAAPWEVHIKVEGVKEAIIPGVGGAATVK